MNATLKRMGISAVSVAVAAAIWLPTMHLVFRPAASDLFSKDGVAPLPRQLANRHLYLWTDPASRQRELAKMRAVNAEWDFMGRSFLAWSLANMALRDPAVRPEALPAIDAIIDETLAIERTKGMYTFLMPYATSRPFVQKPERSQFVDGEIALMLAMRCAVEDKPAYREALRERVAIMVARMEASPSLSAESYPDECWTFCNTVSLAAIRTADWLDGTDHSGLARRWVANAREHLVDPKSGLLISAYRLDGGRIYGPEGSSIWMATHCLALVDEPFAREQYDLACREMGGRLLGFGYAREWPRGMDDHMDVDSGLVIPGVGGSVASSGLAFVAGGPVRRHRLRPRPCRQPVPGGVPHPGRRPPALCRRKPGGRRRRPLRTLARTHVGQGERPAAMKETPEKQGARHAVARGGHPPQPPAPAAAADLGAVADPGRRHRPDLCGLPRDGPAGGRLYGLRHGREPHPRRRPGRGRLRRPLPGNGRGLPHPGHRRRHPCGAGAAGESRDDPRRSRTALGGSAELRLPYACECFQRVTCCHEWRQSGHCSAIRRRPLYWACIPRCPQCGQTSSVARQVRPLSLLLLIPHPR